MEPIMVTGILLFLVLGCIAIRLLANSSGRVGKTLGVVATVATLIVAIALFGFGNEQRMVWDGGYGQAEIEITFLDSQGHSVSGVQLRVEDSDGREFFLYPVSDYLPDHIPTSDKEGHMVLHHVSYGVEFSGRCREVYGQWVDIDRGPEFVCRFLQNGQEVARIPFGKLDHWAQRWETMPRVKRQWRQPIWPTTELYSKLDESFSDWTTRLRTYYDPEGKGHLTPEAAPAFRAATSLKAEEAAIAWLGERKRIEAEEEFVVLKRRITVPVGRK
jgi:hypothetical protein